MTITNLGNGQLRGLSSDTKPTTYPTGATFFETNTGSSYYWNGSSWTAISGGGGLSSPADIAGVNFADVAITNASSPYTVLSTKTIIRADATSGNITMNLPTASGIAGRLYKIYRTDILSSTNLITIDGNSTETIDSNLTYILYPGEWIHIESDGANWQVIARAAPTGAGYYFDKGSTSDRRYVAAMNGTSVGLVASSTLPALNTLWAIPIIVSKTTKFDTITFRVTTVASAGGVARAGIYRDNGNNYPGALIFDTGSIAVDTGTTKNTTITSSVQIFQPGLYWLAWECGTAAPQIRVLSGIGGCFNMNGQDANLVAQTNCNYGYSVAHTFGALPDPYTAGATALNTTPAATVPIPAIGLRAI